SENSIPEHIRVIDLSQDFRLKANAVWQSAASSRRSPVARLQSTGKSSHQLVANDQDSVTRDFVYGLPELNREKIRKAKNVANPGCFATAIQLGLLPLASRGLLDSIYTTGITGSTGAGQGLTATSHFSWRANHIQAYKTL